jgi:hypothetical protein
VIAQTKRLQTRGESSGKKIQKEKNSAKFYKDEVLQ